MTTHASTEAETEAVMGRLVVSTIREVIDARLLDAVQPPLPRFLSVKAVAELTSLSTGEVRRLILRRELRVVRYGSRVLVPREAVDEWADALIASQERPVLRALGVSGRAMGGRG